MSVFLLWRESFITTGKKVLVVCLAGCAVVSVFGSVGEIGSFLVRDCYYDRKKSSSRDFYVKLNVSNLNETNLY